MDGIKFYLVLQKRLGDYNIVTIENLDIYEGTTGSNLSNIDAFTCKFTESEIMESIERSNIVRPEYLTGKLRVISEYKHNFDILTKDIFERVNEFHNMLITDKQILNSIYNVYKNNLEDVLTDAVMINKFLELFKKSLYDNDFNKSMELIEQLPYLKARNIYFYINKAISKL